MKIGMIGLGDIASKAYLPVLAQRPDVDLVLCTRDQTRLVSLAQQYRVTKTCHDYRELLALHLDAVMVHAATSAHEEIAAFFIHQGLPVFVDKPLADNFAACERLYELATAHKVPLFVGFNRRYLPILSNALPGFQQVKLDRLTGIRWEKHRYNLSGELRQFVFDDFIHPLDSINLFAQPSLDNAQVWVQRDGDKIGSIDVSWQKDGVNLQAVMNRRFGQTRESVAIQTLNESWQFDSFTQGHHWLQEREEILTLPDWTPMLAAKGFHGMIEDWLAIAAGTKTLVQEVIDRNLSTHKLAEQLVQQIQSA